MDISLEFIIKLLKVLVISIQILVTENVDNTNTFTSTFVCDQYYNQHYTAARRADQSEH